MVVLQPASLQGLLRPRQDRARRIPPLPRQGELDAPGLGPAGVPETNRGRSLGGAGEENLNHVGRSETRVWGSSC